jgi:hypothetical protein
MICSRGWQRNGNTHHTDLPDRSRNDYPEPAKTCQERTNHHKRLRDLALLALAGAIQRESGVSTAAMTVTVVAAYAVPMAALVAPGYLLGRGWPTAIGVPAGRPALASRCRHHPTSSANQSGSVRCPRRSPPRGQG